MTTHRMYGTPTYKSWSSMKYRCQNPNSNRYAHYGDRGIKVCERWQTFVNFFADMGVRPDSMTLDRIDNDGDYCAENCKWSTVEEQMRNRQNSLEVNLPALAIETGIKLGTLYYRNSHGLPLLAKVGALACNGYNRTEVVSDVYTK